MEPHTTRYVTMRHQTPRVTRSGVPILVTHETTRELRPIRDMFMEKVAKADDGCWHWTGHIGSNGYGKFRWPGESSQGAHRASWRIFRGEIPKSRQIDHLCWVRHCVNPDHLRVVTAKENNYNIKLRALKFCPKGHPWTTENTGNGGGYVYCIPCAEAKK